MLKLLLVLTLLLALLLWVGCVQAPEEAAYASLLEECEPQDDPVVRCAEVFKSSRIANPATDAGSS